MGKISGKTEVFHLEVSKKPVGIIVYRRCLHRTVNCLRRFSTSGNTNGTCIKFSRWSGDQTAADAG